MTTYQNVQSLLTQQVGTIIGALAIIVAMYTAILTKRNQIRNERYLYYQYKLDELRNRTERSIEQLKKEIEKDGEYGKYFQIVLNNQKEFARVSEKMKKEFSLFDL